MIRTKYLLIAIASCIVLIFCTGLFMSGDQDSRVTEFTGEQEGIFAHPSDAYTVARYTDIKDTEKRDAFIMRVQSELARDPVSVPVVVTEPARVEETSTLEPTPPAPENEAPTTTTTTTPMESEVISPYGDSNI